MPCKDISEIQQLYPNDWQNRISGKKTWYDPNDCANRSCECDKVCCAHIVNINVCDCIALGVDQTICNRILNWPGLWNSPITSNNIDWAPFGLPRSDGWIWRQTAGEVALDRNSIMRIATVAGTTCEGMPPPPVTLSPMASDCAGVPTGSPRVVYSNGISGNDSYGGILTCCPDGECASMIDYYNNGGTGQVNSIGC